MIKTKTNRMKGHRAHAFNAGANAALSGMVWRTENPFNPKTAPVKNAYWDMGFQVIREKHS